MEETKTKTLYIIGRRLEGKKISKPRYFFETEFSAKRYAELKLEEIYGDGSNPNNPNKAGCQYKWVSDNEFGGEVLYVKPNYAITPRDRDFAWLYVVIEVTNEQDVFVGE